MKAFVEFGKLLTNRISPAVNAATATTAAIIAPTGFANIATVNFHIAAVAALSDAAKVKYVTPPVPAAAACPSIIGIEVTPRALLFCCCLFLFLTLLHLPKLQEY